MEEKSEDKSTNVWYKNFFYTTQRPLIFIVRRVLTYKSIDLLIFLFLMFSLNMFFYLHLMYFLGTIVHRITRHSTNRIIF